MIISVPWEGSTIFLSVSKGMDAFNFIAGKDGKWACTLSDAAQHVYAAFGKDWPDHASRKKEARKRERAKELEHAVAAGKRDCPWPYSPPDLEGLAFLHSHTLHNDRWIDSKGPPASV